MGGLSNKRATSLPTNIPTASASQGFYSSVLISLRDTSAGERHELWKAGRTPPEQEPVHVWIGSYYTPLKCECKCEYVFMSVCAVCLSLFSGEFVFVWEDQKTVEAGKFPPWYMDNFLCLKSCMTNKWRHCSPITYTVHVLYMGKSKPRSDFLLTSSPSEIKQHHSITQCKY